MAAGGSQFGSLALCHEVHDDMNGSSWQRMKPNQLGSLALSHETHEWPFASMLSLTMNSPLRSVLFPYKGSSCSAASGVCLSFFAGIKAHIPASSTFLAASVKIRLFQSKPDLSLKQKKYKQGTKKQALNVYSNKHQL